MQFDRIIGDCDPAIVKKAEERLTDVFLGLALKYDNQAEKTEFNGGDPLTFTLVYPAKHICTANMPTAATDGNQFYWNPEFVLSLSNTGLRIVAVHEGLHSIYMHPSRRGGRNAKLWNVCVDYLVNTTIMEDLKHRGKDNAKIFKEHLGNYMTIKQYADWLANPAKLPPGMNIVEEAVKAREDIIKQLPKKDDDVIISKEVQEQLKSLQRRSTFFYADTELPEDLETPERLYDYFMKNVPKCPTCGKVGQVHKSKLGQKPKNQKGNQPGKNNPNKGQPGNGPPPCPSGGPNPGGNAPGNQPGQAPGPGNQGQPGQQGQNGNQPGQQGNQPGNQPGQGQCSPDGCPSCGGDDFADVFGFGGTVDDHMDAEGSREEIARKLAEAIENAKRMAGYVPAGLDEELGELTAPKIRWQESIRGKLKTVRQGNAKNDYTKFRTRPMFAGLLVPKRRAYTANFGCLLDCSGSMSQQDIAYGISQLQALDDKSEGWVVPADSDIYWDNIVKLKNMKKEELKKVEVVGRGGTMFGSFFEDYEKKGGGKCNFLLMITDGYLLDNDLATMKNPGIPVYWIITSENATFKPPFGKVFYLHN